MNRRLTTAVAIVAAASVMTLAAGCGSDETSPVPTGADLKGTWVQEGAGYESGKSITWTNQTVVVNSADGQGFSGYKEYTPAGGGDPQRETFNGVIGLDGEVFISDGDGFYEGRIEDGAFIGEYVEVGTDSTAMNVTFTRK